MIRRPLSKLVRRGDLRVTERRKMLTVRLVDLRVAFADVLSCYGQDHLLVVVGVWSSV